mgnify:CR=1 FL=1
MNTNLLRLKMVALLTILLLSTNSLNAITLFENFDNPGSTVKSFTGGGAAIIYPSGTWYMFYNQMGADDRFNGTSAVRMRGYTGGNYTQMNFDKAGAGVLSFNYGSYSNHSGGEFTIQKSINGGTVWETIGNPVVIPKWSGTLLTYSLPVNYSGNIRFKIVVTCRTPNNANEQFNIDDFMITDYGTEQVATPTSSSPTGIYETSQTVTLNTVTSGATIYYTTDGTVPSTSSSVYSTPLNISTTTKIRMIAVAAGKVDSREEVVLITFPEQISTLAEFYTRMAATGTNLTYYKYIGEATVTASYTATYKTLFLQDNTAGMLISDPYRNIVTTFNQGDKITNIIAQVNRINDSPQLYPYNDFSLVSTGNTIVPPVVTLANIPNRTNQLVQINELYFDEANETKTFGPNSPYIIHDVSMASTTTTFRTPSSMPNPDYINTIIPAKRNVIVIVAKNSSAVTTHTIFARNATDLDVQLSGINQIKPYNLTTFGNSVYFETVAPVSVKVFSISGQVIKNFVSEVGKNTVELTKGVYIIHIGNKTAKILL